MPRSWRRGLSRAYRGGLAALLLPAAAVAGDGTATAPAAPAPAPFQRGVSWVAGREPVTRAHLLPLRDQHVDWIVQTPFGWQKDVGSPQVFLAGQDDRVWWGERDEGIETTARLARELGIRTLLKPHIWLTAHDGSWPGQISMQDEGSWDAWFASYRTFILHYAQLAERAGIAALCVGTELHAVTVARPDDWRRLITDVRRVFHGRLTYAANWHEEFEQVAFWDALDFIGIQAYFPLSDQEMPSVDALKAGWRPHLEAIARVHRRTGKPVVFTEIGYRSTRDAAMRPWEWPRREMADQADPETQANGYRAFFEAVWPQEWLAGAYWWKWYPSAGGTSPGRSFDFTPQGKPAALIMAEWYGRPRAGDVATIGE